MSRVAQVWCVSEGAQKVPFSDSKCPEGAVGPERVRRPGGAAGGARAEQARPGRGRSRSTGERGGQQCRQQGEEGETRLNGCDKWAASAHDTERKGKEESRGRPGQCELPTAPRAAAPAPARPESSLAAAGRKIRATGRPLSTWDPIQPSLRPAQESLSISVGFRWGVGAPGEERPRWAVADPCGGWAIHAEPLLKPSVLLVPVPPLLRQVNPFPEQTSPAWRPPCPAVRASLPRAAPRLPEAPRGSQGLQGLPEAPRGSQGLPAFLLFSF